MASRLFAHVRTPCRIGNVPPATCILDRVLCSLARATLGNGTSTTGDSLILSKKRRGDGSLEQQGIMHAHLFKFVNENGYSLFAVDKRVQELLAQAEKCRKEAKTLADEAEASLNRNLISHDVVIGCAANLLLEDRQSLRELAHKKDGCRCHAIRARRRAERGLLRSKEQKQSEEDNKVFLKDYARAMEREDSKKWVRKQLPVMAARRMPPARYNPLPVQHAGPRRWNTREVTQPSMSGLRCWKTSSPA